MKKSLLLSFALVLTGLNSNAQWTLQYSAPNYINSVFFVNADIGYVSGYLGVILKTTDAGETWDPLPSGTSLELFCITFPAADTGYAVGEGGTILKTTDGGTSWISQPSGTTSNLINVCFIGNTGYVVGDDATILKTMDGGITWIPQESGTSSNLKAVYFTNMDTGYVVGGMQPNGNSGVILKTINGGMNWTTVSDGIFNLLFSVFFTDDLTGYAAGGDAMTGTILKTTDAGENWTNIENIPSGPLRRLYFPNASAGWAVSKYGDIIQTSDSGVTWNLQQSATTEYLFGLFFTNEDTGYAVGGDNNGIILKTTNGGFPVGINEKQQAGSLIISPNPAREKIIIEFSELGNSMNGTVSVFGMTGQEVIRQQVQGSTTEIYVSSLPTGIYFIRLMNNEKTGFGKFVKE